MRMSDAGRRFLEVEEGIKNEMYHDQVGLPTIGVGHLLTRSELTSGKIRVDGEEFKWGDGLTDAQVDTLFKKDLGRTEDFVEEYLEISPTTGQFDALCSLAFNIGLEAFIKSSLLGAINAEEWDKVPDLWRGWKYSKKKVLPVLVQRRERELKLFNS